MGLDKSNSLLITLHYDGSGDTIFNADNNAMFVTDSKTEATLVALMTLGDSSKFIIKYESETHSFVLNHGSVIPMEGLAQGYSPRAVRAIDNGRGMRTILKFRWIKTHTNTCRFSRLNSE